jgi:hypothetical protein
MITEYHTEAFSQTHRCVLFHVKAPPSRHSKVRVAGLAQLHAGGSLRTTTQPRSERDLLQGECS